MVATRADVRRIAVSLLGAQEAEDSFAFSVTNKGKQKGFVWTWQERVHPKKPRVPNPGVIAVRVATLGQKDLLLSADPVSLFTEPHYNGYPAVLVRLESVSIADLELLISDAWRCQAPAKLAATLIAAPERPSAADEAPNPRRRGKRAG
jgi:hypothetical protein